MTKPSLTSKYKSNDHIQFKDGRIAIVDEVYHDFAICYVKQERILFRREQLEELAGEPERWE